MAVILVLLLIDNWKEGRLCNLLWPYIQTKFCYKPSDTSEVIRRDRHKHTQTWYHNPAFP